MHSFPSLSTFLLLLLCVTTTHILSLTRQDDWRTWGCILQCLEGVYVCVCACVSVSVQLLWADFSCKGAPHTRVCESGLTAPVIPSTRKTFLRMQMAWAVRGKVSNSSSMLKLIQSVHSAQSDTIHQGRNSSSRSSWEGLLLELVSDLDFCCWLITCQWTGDPSSASPVNRAWRFNKAD